MIYIRTVAYNAEQTLKRAVDSILNQTYDEFKYYLCDNGSTDNGKTRKIVEEYAKSDNRIMPFYNQKNHVWDNNLEIITLVHDIEDEDFFCILDADDEYNVTFLEEMIAFMNKQDLDIAACGSDFINAGDNKLVGRRILSQNLILQGNDFANHFTVYHQFIRTIWGKLFKGKATKKTILGIDPNDPIPRSYGNDTFFTMCALKGANRVGILAKSLHKYYISNQSTSYNFHPERIKCDIILHEAALDMLKPYGEISIMNQSFLNAVYYNATKDTLNVLFNSSLPILKRMQLIREVFTSKYMRAVLIDVLNNDDMFHYKLFRQNILEYIISQNDARNSKGAHLVAEIIELMYIDFKKPISDNCFEYLIKKMPVIVEYMLLKDYSRILESLRTWFRRHNPDVPSLTELEIFANTCLDKSDEEIFKLLVDIKKCRPQSSKALDINSQICKLIENYPLLRNMSADLLADFQESIYFVIKKDYRQALDKFIIIKDVEINDKDVEAYILFSQNLSATAEDTGVFIYFKKVWISFLIECSRIEEASDELDEYMSILSDDEDFAELQKKIQRNKTENNKHSINPTSLTQQVIVPVEYYSCNMINSFFLNFNGRLSGELMAFCCEGIDDKPCMALSETGEETVKRFVALRDNVIEESKNFAAGFTGNRKYTTGCVKCANYQLKEWSNDGLIHYINFSMYPAPCQSRCFYCTVHNGEFGKSSRVIATQLYDKMFATVDCALKTGLIASETVYQISSGEISIHPFKDKIFEYIKGRRTFFYTNCFAFDENIADNLKTNPNSAINLSIDAGTPATWKKVKCVDNFDVVTTNLVKYYKSSARPGQITLKYIVLPGVNDNIEDYQSVIEIMKLLEVNHLTLSRDTRIKYAIDDEYGTQLIYSTASFVAMLHSAARTFDMFTFTPSEQEEVIRQATELLKTGEVSNVRRIKVPDTSL